MNDENGKPEPSFAIFAECRDFERPLIMTGLSFGRLIDDIVKPLEEGGNSEKMGTLVQIQLDIEKGEE